jgi:methionine-rich copper-binding protein CopC
MFVLSACGGDETTTSSGPAGGEIKTPHFVDSYPLHEEVFAQTPELVVVNFDFDLGAQSAIQVTWEGGAVTAGPTEIFNDTLSMRVPLADGADGAYQVAYTAYWPDGTSHDGSYTFSVDSTTLSEYVDMTGQQTVTVDMTQLAFEPARMIIT